MKYARSDRAYLGVNFIILVVIGVVVLGPLCYVVIASFSTGARGGISIEGYRAVFEYRGIWRGYGNSLFYMLCGTAINLFVTLCAAYPLAQKGLKGRGIVLFLFAFTMYFSGGLIPNYLLMRRLGLLNTVWAVLLPGALSVYNMIVMRTYFETQIPDELREAAELDGCPVLRFVATIVLPLSKPIFAVIGLFYAVGHWNAYFNAMIYLSNRALYPLQVVLREILILNQLDTTYMEAEELLRLQERADLMRYSLIVVASAPVMAAYPFVQKYFVKGLMIGAIKG